MQRIPDALSEELISMTKHVFDHITDERRQISNVTEWCKKEECWVLLKAKEYILSSNIEDFLLDKSEQKEEQRRGRREQNSVNQLKTQVYVIEKGPKYWQRAIDWGNEKGLLNDVEISFLKAATRMNWKLPTEKQCMRIAEIEDKLVEDGFTEKDV